MREFIGESAATECVAASLSRQYLRRLRFSLADESEDCERSVALVDKASAFIREAFRSCEVASKGTDLAKCIVAIDVVNAPLARLLYA